MTHVRIAAGFALLLLVVGLAGCGGGSGEAVIPPTPNPTPDVGVNGTITVGTSSLSSAALNLVDDQDSLDVANSAQAIVRHVDAGTTITVPFSILVDGRGIEFGEIPLEVGMNIIELKATAGYVIGFVDGRSHTVLFIGRLEVGIEMLEHGTVIAPTQFELVLPTDNGDCEPPPPPADNPQRQAIFRGLAPGDHVRGRVRDRFGGESVRDTEANNSGVATINDYKGGITTHNLSGPNSLVGFYFAEHEELLP